MQFGDRCGKERSALTGRVQVQSVEVEAVRPGVSDRKGDAEHLSTLALATPGSPDAPRPGGRGDKDIAIDFKHVE